MEVNSLATGMDAALADAALEIARLPDLSPEVLGLVEGAMLFIGSRDGAVSMQTVQAGVEDRLTAERLETVFFALTQAGVLTRRKRDQRGYAFDRYHVDPHRLRQIMHDVSVARHVLTHVQAEGKQAGQIELIATLPDSLSLDPEIRRTIPSLAAALHRLIIGAEREIIILNPFFEQTGFDRLASALLAAAGRGVTIAIITRELTDLTSTNRQVVGGLVRRATAGGLSSRFRFYQHQQVEAGRFILASHAKVLLADGESAYIGSANLTEYGMARFVEIGVLLEGPKAKQLRQILRAILESHATEQVHDL